MWDGVLTLAQQAQHSQTGADHFSEDFNSCFFISAFFGPFLQMLFLLNKSIFVHFFLNCECQKQNVHILCLNTKHCVICLCTVISVMLLKKQSEFLRFRLIKTKCSGFLIALCFRFIVSVWWNGNCCIRVPLCFTFCSLVKELKWGTCSEQTKRNTQTSPSKIVRKKM